MSFTTSNIENQLPGFSFKKYNSDTAYSGRGHSHSGWRNGDRKNYNPEYIKAEYSLGIECEKEENTIAHDYSSIHAASHWCLETDGSLGEGGFELTSPVIPFDITHSVYAPENEAWVNTFFTPVEQLLSARFTERAGGHIHLSHRSMNNQTIHTMIRYLMPIYYGLMPHRVGRGYSIATQFSKHSQHRGCFHFSRHSTLEFRIFSAVESKANLLSRIELMRLTLKYANQFGNYMDMYKMLFDDNHEIVKHIKQNMLTKEVPTYEAFLQNVFKYIISFG